MPDFTVHTIPGSPYARAVIAALEEKSAVYKVARLAPGEQHSPAYLALHPFGKMPVLEHDGRQIYETQAILRYVDRILPIPPLTPSDTLLAARTDTVLNINDCYLFPGVANVIVFQRVIGPMLMGTSPDDAVIAAAMPAAHRVFAELSRLLGEDPFFGGKQVSLADLAIGPQFELFARAPEWQELTQERPNLVAFLNRMEGRPSMRSSTMERVAEMARAA